MSDSGASSKREKHVKTDSPFQTVEEAEPVGHAGRLELPVGYNASIASALLAVASGGQLSVTVAESTTDPDGGSLTVQATDLPLYHPTNTPYGDISQDILSMGMLVCDLE